MWDGESKAARLRHILHIFVLNMSDLAWCLLGKVVCIFDPEAIWAFKGICRALLLAMKIEGGLISECYTPGLKTKAVGGGLRNLK